MKVMTATCRVRSDRGSSVSLDFWESLTQSSEVVNYTLRLLTQAAVRPRRHMRVNNTDACALLSPHNVAEFTRIVSARFFGGYTLDYVCLRLPLSKADRGVVRWRHSMRSIQRCSDSLRCCSGCVQTTLFAISSEKNLPFQNVFFFFFAYLWTVVRGVRSPS